MTREERKQSRRTERRKGRQADHVLTAAVWAIGAGDAKDWTQDSPNDAKRRLRAEKDQKRAAARGTA